MGTVWSAYDEVLHRPVAVKEVRLSLVPVSERAIVRERTLREARATAMLSHPNVVTLYDVVEVDSEPYVVMELLPSRSLASYIGERGTLSHAETAEIGSAVASALMTAHRAGITHRDVKPGNVLIGTDGQIKLTDFGIARNAAESSMTQTGTVLGSPPYIAPEVAMGRAVGPPADLWGLGATLFACLEGRPPYDAGDPVSTVSAVVHGEIPRPSGQGPVVDVVRGLMVKDPGLRMPLPAVRRRLRPLMADPEGPMLSAPSSPATTEFRIPEGQPGPQPPPPSTDDPRSGLIPVRGRSGTLVEGADPAGERPPPPSPAPRRPSPTPPAPRTAPIADPGRDTPPGDDSSSEAAEALAAPAEAPAGGSTAPSGSDDEGGAAGAVAAAAASGTADAASSTATRTADGPGTDGDRPTGTPDDAGSDEAREGAEAPAADQEPDEASTGGAADAASDDEHDTGAEASAPDADGKSAEDGDTADQGADDAEGTGTADAAASEGDGSDDAAGDDADDGGSGAAAAVAGGAAALAAGGAAAVAAGRAKAPSIGSEESEPAEGGSTADDSGSDENAAAKDAGSTKDAASGTSAAAASAGVTAKETSAPSSSTDTGKTTTEDDQTDDEAATGDDAPAASTTPSSGTPRTGPTKPGTPPSGTSRPGTPPSGTTRPGTPPSGTTRPSTPSGGTPRTGTPPSGSPRTPTPSSGSPAVPEPSAAETTMVTPRLTDPPRPVPRPGPSAPGPWSQPYQRPRAPMTPQRRPGSPQALASDPGPLPFAPSRSAPAGPSRMRRVGVVVLVVVLALAGLLGGYAAVRMIGGQPPFSVSLAPAGPVVDGVRLVSHTDDNARYSGTGMGFTALVPSTWQQFRLQEPTGDIVVRYVSDDATRELRIDRLVHFYPAQRAAAYVALLADPSRLGADAVRVEPVTVVAPPRAGAQEPVQQTVYRARSGATDDRTTWTRLIPSGTDLWVVRMTAPSTAPGGTPEQFATVADSFTPPV
ncbi:protein kinase [Actinomycetospora endophytica]|uniref:Protein kinase n=2 Tax=Actinomycetospora endophytica TaxID=2291215 RepID=A0ABS8PGK4_9PSEU|nr:protein kinase [Actinomycetospora endophytica]